MKGLKLGYYIAMGVFIGGAITIAVLAIAELLKRWLG